MDQTIPELYKTICSVSSIGRVIDYIHKTYLKVITSMEVTPTNVAYEVAIYTGLTLILPQIQ